MIEAFDPVCVCVCVVVVFHQIVAVLAISKMALVEYCGRFHVDE